MFTFPTQKGDTPLSGISNGVCEININATDMRKLTSTKVAVGEDNATVHLTAKKYYQNTQSYGEGVSAYEDSESTEVEPDSKGGFGLKKRKEKSWKISTLKHLP